jgi:hypothetical protein
MPNIISLLVFIGLLAFYVIDTKTACPHFGPAKVNCFVDPCMVNKCLAGEICCSDYTKGCDHHCIKEKLEFLD